MQNKTILNKTLLILASGLIATATINATDTFKTSDEAGKIALAKAIFKTDAEVDDKDKANAELKNLYNAIFKGDASISDDGTIVCADWKKAGLKEITSGAKISTSQFAQLVLEFKQTTPNAEGYKGRTIAIGVTVALIVGLGGGWFLNEALASDEKMERRRG